MVSEIEEGQIGAQGAVAGPSGIQSVRGVSRDRWGDIYANMPVKRMIALYDYDPQELSPNVDAEVNVGILLVVAIPFSKCAIFLFYFFACAAASGIEF